MDRHALRTMSTRAEGYLKRVTRINSAQEGVKNRGKKRSLASSMM